MKRLGFRGTFVCHCVSANGTLVASMRVTLVCLCVSSNGTLVASMCFLKAQDTIPKLLVVAKDANGVATVSRID